MNLLELFGLPVFSLLSATLVLVILQDAGLAALVAFNTRLGNHD